MSVRADTVVSHTARRVMVQDVQTIMVMMVIIRTSHRADMEISEASGDSGHLDLADIQEAMVAMDMAVIISMVMILQQCDLRAAANYINNSSMMKLLMCLTT